MKNLEFKKVIYKEFLENIKNILIISFNERMRKMTKEKLLLVFMNELQKEETSEIVITENRNDNSYRRDQYILNDIVETENGIELLFESGSMYGITFNNLLDANYNKYENSYILIYESYELEILFL